MSDDLSNSEAIRRHGSEFVCDGCGKPRDVGDSLVLRRATLHIDGELQHLRAGRFCPVCVTDWFGEEDSDDDE